jgi:amino acid adenylation domain-containing protein
LSCAHASVSRVAGPWVRSWSTHCVHECFEAQAHQEPAAIALRGDEGQISFQELNRRANCLAQRLIRLGVGPDQLVAIYLERSFDLVTSLLGVLKAGGAYVGLELNAPAPQLQCILDDARPTVIITSRRLAKDLPQSNAAMVFPEELDWQKELSDRAADSDPRSGAAPTDLAYVSFTSGSTGRPKGVCIRHRGVVRLAVDSRHLHVSAEEVFLQLSPISFDASTFEIWASLLNGASLAVYPANRPLSDLGEIIREHGVTTLWLTSGLFNSVVDANLEALRPIRRLFAGGDVLSVAHVRKAFAALPDCRITNGYGPTENTTFTCCYEVQALPPEDRPLPIGTPLDHNEIYVLDDQLRPVEQGAVGELFAGGDGLARGYLNLPDLTAKAFPPHPFASDLKSRVYRTGDLVRQLPGGELEFVGRIDGQVKIRGYRVEPEAVEAALCRHPAVRDAAVVTQSRSGRKHLIAFVCHHRAVEPTPPDNVELTRFLRASIPPYMIPSDILFLGELPLTPTGKVDRQALSQTKVAENPAPDADDAAPSGEGAAPYAKGAGPSPIPAPSPTPAPPASAGALAKIWQKVLGRSRVLPEQDLWELAPDSVQVLDLLLHVAGEFGRTLSVETLLTAPTAAALADVLDRGLENRSGSIIPLQPGGTRRHSTGCMGREVTWALMPSPRGTWLRTGRYWDWPLRIVPVS